MQGNFCRGVVQTFPDEFEFNGSASQKIQQIGNAIGPLLAKIKIKNEVKIGNGGFMNTTKRWEVYDRYGNKIYMTVERWEHAQEKRPWLAGY